MKKKLVSFVLGTVLAVTALTGCGAASGNGASAASAGSAGSAKADTAGSAPSDGASGTSAAAGSSYDFSADPIDLKLGVVGSIYEDLWQPAVDQLAKEGINLEIVQFSDYVTPNSALANGEIDLDAFQHQIYLDSEVDQYGYEISNIANTFIIPLNLYSAKIKSVDELKDGDTIAVPNDLTNEGRALKVLAAAGIITLKDGADFNPTLDDIESKVADIEIKELAANTIPSSLQDVTAAVVNGNYALDFGLKTEEALYKDSVLDQKEYWNLIAARAADLKDHRLAAAYKEVVEAFQSDETKAVFDDQYGGYFIAVGWDEDLFTKKQ